MLLTRDEVDKNKPMIMQQSNFDASGLDCILILLRHLFTLGFEIQSQYVVSEAETTLLDVARLDLGWDRKEDFEAKRKILDSLQLPTKAIRYSDLRSRKDLRNIFGCNKQFVLVQPETIGEGGDIEIDQVLTFDSEISDLRITYRGHKPLGRLIEDIFSVGVANGTRPVSSRPKFLEIKYVNDGMRYGIGHFRVLKFDAPEIRNGQKGIQQARYHLCAVVKRSTNRIGVDDYDKIRTYSEDGTEIIQAQIGLFRSKEPSNTLGWTISEDGEFSLYYRRVSRHDSEAQFDVDAKEYEEREWIRQESQLRHSSLADFAGSPIDGSPESSPAKRSV